jgi:hypothetical protein
MYLQTFVNSVGSVRDLAQTFQQFGKSFAVTGRGGPQGCETRRTHYVENRLTDGGRCQPYAPAALYTAGRFLVLIRVRG